ncbi:putative G-protein coupled receptor [Trichinella papuae]|uniref:Putative G-protein coupled receptor n=1 Tax=Trichinella papuae TaxID=268474 RepID=A0A0V1M539_9BILA|nr:putative G-protein coupled receptor [Trichinella papuae]
MYISNVMYIINSLLFYRQKQFTELQNPISHHITWKKNNSELLTGNMSEIFLNVINQFHQQYQAVHGHLCIALCLFGIVTNILNCIVLTRRQMRSASNMFLAIIALIDMGLMVFLWLAALFALVRLIVIRRTQDVSLFLTTRFIGKLFCYLAISVAILSIPHALTFTVVQETVPCKEHSENSSIRYTLMPSQLAIAGDCFLLKTTFWINGFPFKLVPCVILFVSILSLVKFLSEAQAKKQRIFGNNKRQQPVRYISRSTTKLLVTILSIFLITEIPQAIVATLSGIFPAEIYAKIYPKVGDLLDLLALINCNANFILLCIMSSQFRTTFASMFLPRRFQCQTTLMLDSTSRTTRIDT